jgi:hypothetical protein
MLIMAVRGCIHQGQWGGGVLFTTALHDQKNASQGQSQPHENHRPHKGVTKQPAMAQLLRIAPFLGTLMCAMLRDQND